MSATDRPVKVLMVGESVFKIHTHFKGFASYETGYITMSLDPFIQRFAGTGIEIDFMPNHEVSLKFPFTAEELRGWDVVVISDAPADSFLLAPDTLAGKICRTGSRCWATMCAPGAGSR